MDWKFDIKVSKNEKTLLELSSPFITAFLLCVLIKSNLINYSGLSFTLCEIIGSSIIYILVSKVPEDETKEGITINAIIIGCLCILMICGIYFNFPADDGQSPEIFTPGILECHDDLPYYKLNNNTSSNISTYEGVKVQYAGNISYPTNLTNDSTQLIVEVNNNSDDLIYVIYPGKIGSKNLSDQIVIYGVVFGKRQFKETEQYYPIIVAFGVK